MKTWGELKAAVLETLDATQSEQHRRMLPQWLSLAESDIYNSLRAGWMVRRGDAIFFAEIEAMPPTLVQVISVEVLSDRVSDEEVAILIAQAGEAIKAGPAQQLIVGDLPRTSRVDIGRQLQPLGPAQALESYDRGGPVRFYDVEGYRLRLYPWPGNPVRVQVVYYSRGNPLRLDSDRNETLDQLPSAYYYAILRHAAIFDGDAEGEQRWSAALIAAIDRANSQAYGYQGDGLVCRRIRP